MCSFFVNSRVDKYTPDDRICTLGLAISLYTETYLASPKTNRSCTDRLKFNRRHEELRRKDQFNLALRFEGNVERGSKLILTSTESACWSNHISRLRLVWGTTNVS